MAVVYKKSELGALLEQLPSLIATQTAAARAEAREDDRMEARFAQEEKMLNLRLESDAASRNLGILLDQKRDLQAEKARLEGTLSKIPGLNPADLTSGAPAIVGPWIEDNKFKQDVAEKELTNLSNYISELKVAQADVSRQVADFDAFARSPQFAGLNKVLQQFEFEKLLNTLEEEAAAGGPAFNERVLRYAYGQMGSAAQIEDLNLRMSEALSQESNVTAANEYAVLQSKLSISADGDINDIVDLQESLAWGDNNENKPSEDELLELSKLIGSTNYKNFIKKLNAYPGEAGRQIREELRNNPNLAGTFKDLEESADFVLAMDRERKGLDPLTRESTFELFKSDLANIENQEDAFRLFEEYSPHLGTNEEAEEYFEYLEDHFGGANLKDPFKAFLGLKDDDPSPGKKPTLKATIGAGVTRDYDDEDIEMQADELRADLSGTLMNQIEDYNNFIAVRDSLGVVAQDAENEVNELEARLNDLLGLEKVQMGAEGWHSNFPLGSTEAREASLRVKAENPELFDLINEARGRLSDATYLFENVQVPPTYEWQRNLGYPERSLSRVGLAYDKYEDIVRTLDALNTLEDPDDRTILPRYAPHEGGFPTALEIVENEFD